MATGDRKFTRIPPESTGDRMHVHAHYQVNYNNKTGAFFIDDIVAGGTSGFTGRIVQITESTLTTGSNSSRMTVFLIYALSNCFS